MHFLRADHLQTPSMKAVAEIAAHAGPGMAVTAQQSIPGPTGTVQIWSFTPQVAPLDRAAVVVAVLLVRGKIALWTPLAESFEQAVARYAALLAALPQDPAAGLDTAVSTPGSTLHLRGLPAGVRVTWTGAQPPQIAGKTVCFSPDARP
ncbi:MAG: hypothetical protein WBO35_04575 [Candidatus Saccharimonadales bacterium]